MSSKKPGDGVLNGFLDQGSHFKGELTFDDTLRIDGKFEGTIRSANQLIVGETAEVDAEIQVGSISIDGTVRGTIVAKSKIEYDKPGPDHSRHPFNDAGGCGKYHKEFVFAGCGGPYVLLEGVTLG